MTQPERVQWMLDFSRAGLNASASDGPHQPINKRRDGVAREQPAAENHSMPTDDGALNAFKFLNPHNKMREPKRTERLVQ